MDFVAIDFETANYSRRSACSLGIIIVEDNDIVNELHYYIKPEPFIFHPNNVMVHGITSDKCCDAPTMDLLWPQIKGYFKNKMIVAHNASFDESVLTDLLDYYKLPIPQYELRCTYQLAKKILPELNNHQLQTVCEYFDIKLKHHDALSDARAAALLYINLMKFGKRSGIIRDFDYKNKRLTVRVGNEGNVYPKYYKDLSSDYFIGINDILEKHVQNALRKLADYEDAEERGWLSFYKEEPTTNIETNIEINNDNEITVDEYKESTVITDEVDLIEFDGSTFVITGDIEGYDRSAIEELIKERGGRVTTSVSKKTDYVIVGLFKISFLKDREAVKSEKITKAEALRDSGHKIKIISSNFFLSHMKSEVL